MVFIGKIEEAARNATLLKDVEKSKTFSNG
jgi:hypothetical protein